MKKQHIENLRKALELAYTELLDQTKQDTAIMKLSSESLKDHLCELISQKLDYYTDNDKIGDIRLVGAKKFVSMCIETRDNLFKQITSNKIKAFVFMNQRKAILW